MSKVMLVEDDNNLREIYGARLEAEGYEIVSAKDGEEALALAVQEKPDLIISDVMMPRISGFDMLDILRNAPETKDTKVIMMTALSQAEDKSRADKLGADRYLVKSQVTLEDVANVVREVLEGPAAPAPETPSQIPAPVTSTEQVAPAAPAMPAAPAPGSVEAIANPVVEVHDEPDPSQVQTPPSDAPVEPTTIHQPFQFKPAEPAAAPPASTPAPAPAAPQPQVVASSAVPVQPVAAAAPTPPAPAPVATPTDNLPPIVQPAAASTPIKVELPQQPATPAPVPAAVPDPTPLPLPATEPDTGVPDFIGPNLAQALATEEAKVSGEQPSAPTAVPVATPPAPSSEPAIPTIINGSPSTTVVQPTQPAPAQSEPTTTPVPEPASGTAAGMRVIQPIGDPLATPDLNKLMADEERKAAVANPTASTVITPETPSTDIPVQQQNLEVKQPPKTDVNNISL